MPRRVVRTRCESSAAPRAHGHHRHHPPDLPPSWFFFFFLYRFRDWYPWQGYRDIGKSRTNDSFSTLVDRGAIKGCRQGYLLFWILRYPADTIPYNNGNVIFTFLMEERQQVIIEPHSHTHSPSNSLSPSLKSLSSPSLETSAPTSPPTSLSLSSSSSSSSL